MILAVTVISSFIAGEGNREVWVRRYVDAARNQRAIEIAKLVEAREKAQDREDRFKESVRGSGRSGDARARRRSATALAEAKGS